MRVILQVTNPSGYKQQIQLYGGQIAQFGRTDWADFSFPDDESMGDLHFALDCRRGYCQFRELETEQPTLLNGQPIKEALLRHGDVITAGQTRFQIQLEEAHEPETPDEAEGAEQAAEAEPAMNPVELCEYLDLDEAAKALAKPDQTPERLLELLTQQEQFGDALRLRAYLLPRPEAIWWGCRCVEEVYQQRLPDADQQALAAARRWSLEPSEEHRRGAEDAANRTKLESGASWVAMAAFWSGGSISLPNLPPVEPDDRLLAKGVTAALLITASFAEPGAAPQRFRNFLASGRQIAKGELKPSASPAGLPDTAAQS